MPELPEVESARRTAERLLRGRRIAAVTAVPDSIVYTGVAPRQLAQQLRGRTVLAVRRRGKHLWFELDRRPWPAFHFGMTGEFFRYRRLADRPRFLKMELRLASGLRFAFADARRLGRIRLLDDPPSVPPISRLGFDPFLDQARASEFLLALGRRKAPVKAVLLDQTVAAGVGNWIADEVLYQARINPHRRAADLSALEARRLLQKLTHIIHTAVAAHGENDRYPRTWLFHARWGKVDGAVTARHEKIIHETIGGRTTAWVPAIQQ